MQGHQTFAQRGQGLEELEVGGEGDAREVYLEEIGVLLAVSVCVEDGVDVVEDLLRRGLFPVGSRQRRHDVGIEVRLPLVWLKVAEEVFFGGVRVEVEGKINVTSAIKQIKVSKARCTIRQIPCFTSNNLSSTSYT